MIFDATNSSFKEMATRLAAVASIDAFVTSLRKDGQTSASVILPVEVSFMGSNLIHLSSQ